MEPDDSSSDSPPDYLTPWGNVPMLPPVLQASLTGDHSSLSKIGTSSDRRVYKRFTAFVTEILALNPGAQSTSEDVDDLVLSMSGLNIAQVLSRSRDLYYVLRQIMQTLVTSFEQKMCMDTSIQEDELDILRELRVILGLEGEVRLVLELQGGDAEGFLEIVQWALDRLSERSGDIPIHLQQDVKFRRRLQMIMIKLSRLSGCLPLSLFTRGIQIISKDPVSGGGYADIFQGQLLGHCVALKRLRIFNPEEAKAKMHQKISKEALVWKQLVHRHIHSFLGIDDANFPGYLCLVSPWLRNGNAKDYLCDNEAAQDRVDHLLYEIAQGVEYLHRRRIIHGDLRAVNILIDDRGHALVSDFGLSDCLERTNGTTSSSNGAGSVRWMAPELFHFGHFGKAPSRRTSSSDVYAFACVCLELYTGHPPFPDLSDAAVLMAILQGSRLKPPRRDECRRGHVVSGVASLMRQCWDDWASRRPPIRDVVRMFSVETMPIETVTPVVNPTQALASPGDLSVVSKYIHVLIVDDNPINRQILSTFMQKTHITHDVAQDGVEACRQMDNGMFWSYPNGHPDALQEWNRGNARNPSPGAAELSEPTCDYYYRHDGLLADAADPRRSAHCGLQRLSDETGILALLT